MIVSLSTWRHGYAPNAKAYEVLKAGGSSLDAVEAGAIFSEEDLTCMSVGLGGIPDSEGQVSLDAAIMDHDGNAGAVCFVRKYLHATSIARRVMERTSHIMLAGEGAELFAAQQGFQKRELLTERSRALFEEWQKQPDKLHVRLRRTAEGEHEYTFVRVEDDGTHSEIDRASLSRSSRDRTSPGNPSKKPVNESHDTIGILALDTAGKLAGACTTSGLAFKLHGRVGDSPILGAGLYVDGEFGAAVATGTGELVMRACSTFHVVELLRQGVEPEKACEIAIDRIRRQKQLTEDMQVGIMTIRTDGKWAARSLRPGFQLAVSSSQLFDMNAMYDVSDSMVTKAVTS